MASWNEFKSDRFNESYLYQECRSIVEMFEMSGATDVTNTELPMLK